MMTSVEGMETARAALEKCEERYLEAEDSEADKLAAAAVHRQRRLGEIHRKNCGGTTVLP